MAKKSNHPQTIKVVDDSADIRELLRDVLNSEGFQSNKNEEWARCGRDCQTNRSRPDSDGLEYACA
jgi:PleD family two-component response regulator